MTQQELKSFFLNTVANGWTEDRYGHLIKETPTGKYRLKFQAKSVRYETQVVHEASQYSPASKSWVRLRSGYYGQLNITDGKLCGMKR